jgi:hypothetical protein
VGLFNKLCRFCGEHFLTSTDEQRGYDPERLGGCSDCAWDRREAEKKRAAAPKPAPVVEGMQLHVYQDYDGVNVWVSNIPSDYTRPSDVIDCVRADAQKGNALCARALDLMEKFPQCVMWSRYSPGTLLLIDA